MIWLFCSDGLIQTVRNAARLRKNVQNHAFGLCSALFFTPATEFLPRAFGSENQTPIIDLIDRPSYDKLENQIQQPNICLLDIAFPKVLRLLNLNLTNLTYHD